jgi:hypothetical protein
VPQDLQKKVDAHGAVIVVVVHVWPPTGGEMQPIVEGVAQ